MTWICQASTSLDCLPRVRRNPRSNTAQRHLLCTIAARDVTARRRGAQAAADHAPPPPSRDKLLTPGPAQIEASPADARCARQPFLVAMPRFVHPGLCG